MTVKTGMLGGLTRRMVTVLTVLAVALSMMMAMGSGEASAANRDYLRRDANGRCTWDKTRYWVQRCDVWSKSMGRTIPVQIQPAKRGGNAGFYLLDGLRATDRTNAWVNDVNAARLYKNSNITLVMPVGGAGSFYADWEGPATYDYNNPVTYKWETFLTKELPGYLQRQFGVSPTNNSIAGLSMGGTAAITLAGKHPRQFRQALSYSGYLNTSIPGAHTLMRLALLDSGGFNLNAMYGSIVSPRRFDNDPYNVIGGLRNTDVYVSAASGMPGPQDAKYSAEMKASGSALEFISMASTRMWEAKARSMGVNPTVHYPATGLHNWTQFGSELARTKSRVLNEMNAW
ncbi:alpha/beta hydrolase [Corynebacterium incognita]|nr:alpha/beta hydrolase family protein [Corynebacterium incognita]